ncbi:hypothetical protein [Calothrix sp. CCY 0018]|uniref:hypothetical protein n=1 Tax=Calothrix sp. CCY 0018 TaxID=3103864 RepID=UPI0039C72261
MNSNQLSVNREQLSGRNNLAIDIFGNEKNLSPNLSPTRREALKPPFPAPGRGAGGLGQSVNLKPYKCFPEMSNE